MSPMWIPLAWQPIRGTYLTLALIGATCRTERPRSVSLTIHLPFHLQVQSPQSLINLPSISIEKSLYTTRLLIIRKGTSTSPRTSFKCFVFDFFSLQGPASHIPIDLQGPASHTPIDLHGPARHIPMKDPVRPQEDIPAQNGEPSGLSDKADKGAPSSSNTGGAVNSPCARRRTATTYFPPTICP